MLIANVNKDAKIITGGETIVNASKDVTVSSDSLIKLQKGASASPSEPFVKGAKFKAFMSDLLSAIGQITHIGNLGAPTPPPLNAAQFSSLSSRLDELLSELIKGM
jgi:hypothetical protein